MKKYFSALLLCLTIFVISAQNPSTLVKPPTETASVQKGGLIEPQPSIVANTTVNPDKVQPTIDITQLSADNIFNSLIDPIYSGLLILLGLLSSFIPGLQKIDNKAVRVMSIAIILGLGFYLYGGLAFWKIALSILFSNIAYIVSIKPLIKSGT